MKGKTSLTHAQVHDTIHRIAEGSHTAEDISIIISHFYYSKDISALSILLDSNDDSSVRDGAYILSEIGRSGTSLRERAKSLLEHPDVQTRYWAMNAVVSCFDPEEARAVIMAAGLLQDPDDFVQTRAGEMLGALR